jgi:RNA polymerase sigma-70 factor (ECF subfamily)
LPEQQKIVVQMRDVEQYEFAEIAQILQMNETAIRVAFKSKKKQ